VKAFTVQDGEKADLPPAPEKARHVFEGWYADSELTEPFRFDDPILRNVTLYAKWTPLFYLVSFESNGGSAVEAAEVIPGETVLAPETERAHYTIEGWYADSELTVPFLFDEPVYGDTTLYAKWTGLFLVSFESNGGSAVEAAEVIPGETVAATASVVKEGYIFAGWYADSALTEAFDFGKPVEGDVVVYAKWSDAFEIVEAVSAYLSGGTVAESGTENDPVKLKVRINFAGSAWGNFSNALSSSGKYFALDLSESRGIGGFNSNITDVVLPDDVTSINKGHSYNGGSLRSIRGANVLTIGEYAFANSGVAKLDFPELREIKSAAFQRSAVVDLRIPKIETIDYGAFTYNNNKDLLLTLGATPPKVGNHLFLSGYETVNKTITLKLPVDEVFNLTLGLSGYNADWQRAFKYAGNLNGFSSANVLNHADGILIKFATY
jgi:uncharacterized repeat protein (TIGR02543 family)